MDLHFFTQYTRSWSVIPSGVTPEFTRFSGCDVNIKSMIEAEVLYICVCLSLRVCMCVSACVFVWIGVCGSACGCVWVRVCVCVC